MTEIEQRRIRGYLNVNQRDVNVAMERVRVDIDALLRHAAALQRWVDDPKPAQYIASLEKRVAALQAQLGALRDENYQDLLDQMVENWGHNCTGDVSRAELNAFLETRIVHKPTTSLRARLRKVEQERDMLSEAMRQGAILYEPVIEQQIEDFRRRAVEAVRAAQRETDRAHGFERAIELLQQLPATAAITATNKD